MFQTTSKTVLDDPRTWAREAAVQNYVSSAMIALIVWEYMITVKKEVEFIWRRKPTRITTLFFVNRYGILLYGALAITAGFVQEHTACVVVTRATEAVILLLTLVFSICAALRAYVLWNKNWCFSIIVLAMNLAPEGVDIFLYWSSTPTSTPIVIASCVSRLRLGRQQQMRMVAAARVAMIIVDSIVLYAMLMKTLAIQKEANKAQIRSLVIDTLIRDGTIYFLAVLATSLAHLLVFQATEQVYLKAFICSLSAILVSRFFLNLREAAAGGREIEEL